MTHLCLVPGSCWVAQIASHKIFEGRAPALLDNLAQAFLMAPFFVFLEVLFKFGYRKDFQDRMQIVVRRNIAEYRKTLVKVK